MGREPNPTSLLGFLPGDPQLQVLRLPWVAQQVAMQSVPPQHTSDFFFSILVSTKVLPLGLRGAICRAGLGTDLALHMKEYVDPDPAITPVPTQSHDSYSAWLAWHAWHVSMATLKWGGGGWKSTLPTG